MIKLLHTADLHLDSPFRALGPANAAARRDGLRRVFSSICATVRNEEIDLLLIAGDLFDADFVTVDTAALIRSELAAVAPARVVISPGNHDPYSPGSVWESLDLPENVHVFSSDMLGRVSFPELNADVYGYAFVGSALRKNPLASAEIADPSRINIVCAHADVRSPLSPDAPISRDQIAAFGADYAAFGHIHNAEGFEGREGRCYWAYSGCPEGRSFDECGRKSAIIATVGKTNGEGAVSIERREFTKRRFELASTDVTGCQSSSELREKILGAAAVFDPDTFLRLTLTGQTAAPIYVGDIGTDAPLAGLEIRDETLPVWNAGLETDRTLRGEFYRAILPRLESADVHEREVATRALRYAFSALSGEDIPEEAE